MDHKTNGRAVKHAIFTTCSLVYVIIGGTKLGVGDEMALRLLIRETTTSFSTFDSSNIDIFNKSLLL